MVATLGFNELHATTLDRLTVLPSLYVPVAANCWVSPAATAGLEGATAIETSVGGGFTVSTADPLTAPALAVTIVEPAEPDTANPTLPGSLLISATAPFEELQLTDA